MTILGRPVAELFLYFMLYSFLGWLVESCYCSIQQHRLVPRGFLYGPVCPIYGAGALVMILFFTPLKHNLLLFYLAAVVGMSAWEFFVGWLLEVTTHVKYWDYSQYRFNLKGRICLWVALVWGVLAYVVIFWIHPPVQQLYQRIPAPLVSALCWVLLILLLADTALTLRHLALISRLVASITRAQQQLQVQMALGRAELGDRLEEKSAQLQEKYAAKTAALRNSYQQQIARLERHSRRFRRRYARMKTAGCYQVSAADIRAAAQLAREELLRRRAARRHRPHSHKNR